MNKTRIFLIVALLSTTLACAAFERLVFGEPEPVEYVEPVAPIEPAAEEPATEVPEPVAEPQESPEETSSCPNGDCITACVSDLSSIVDRPATNELRGKFNSSGSSEETTLVTYTIDGDQIIDPVFEDNIPSKLRTMQQNTVGHENIWRYFAAMIPLDQRTFLNQYVINTDGKDEILASVAQSYDDPEAWDLYVDMADADNPQDLTFTLIHEFGHLLTLNPDQIEPNVAIFENPDDPDVYYDESLSCDTYFTYEGCTGANSYLNLFVEAYWADLYNEWLDIDAEEDEDTYYERLDNFYYKYEDQFVSDYAVTNPEEDIAETFSYFILESKPAGNTIAEEKILFFYQFPELVKLREQIAVGLCGQVK